MPEEKPLDRLKRAYAENPIQFMAAFGMVATGAAKLIDAVYGAKSKRAYAKQINRSSRRR